MKYTISGEIAQSARLDIERGDEVWASKGSIMAHSPGIEWTLRVPGGLAGGARRTLSGEGVALTYIEAKRPGQNVLLTANQPGHITTWDLSDGPIVTTRGSFLAAWGDNVEIDVTIARRAGAAIFGGVGLFLQKVSGVGTVLVHASGDFYEQQLDKGEQLVTSTGSLAAFDGGVDYDIQRVGGWRRTLFGGEGFFMTRLTGPGRVLLQTLKRQSASEKSS